MGLGWRQWARERLTVQQMQGYLQDQTIAVFASAAARDAVLPADPPEGMHVYLIDSGRTLVRVGAAGGSWQIVSPNPGRRVQKTDTQAVAIVNTWVAINWNAPGAEPLVGAGIFVPATPSRFFATATGRWRLQCGLNGATNLQIRYNSAGNNAAGSMQGAATSADATYLNAIADGVVMNAGDHLEAFATRSTTTGAFGSISGYPGVASMQYLGRS